jgi:uncharacterized membrane protein
MVVLTERGRRRLNQRRAVFVVMVGTVGLSHYSTAYLVVVVLTLALLADHAWRLMVRARRRIRPASCFMTAWMVAVVAVATVVWNGPLTHTTGQFRSTTGQAVAEVIDRQHAKSGSSDTSYSLLGGSTVSAQQRLDEYRQQTLRWTAGPRAKGAYPPLSETDKRTIQAVDQPNMPLTKPGRALQHATGLDVAAISQVGRQSAARLLQVLLLVGLVICLWSRRRPFRPSRDQVTLSAAMLFVIGLFLIMPQLSVDYGVLRVFQQGLLIFAPFIAAGSLWMLRWARRWMVPAASTLALLIFLNLTGAIPQLIGGPPAQLNLNNAGRDYDIYYVQPEERAAITWVDAQNANDRRGEVQSEVLTDRYSFSRLQKPTRWRGMSDIFPTLISTDSYVFLGSTTVRKHEAPISYRGDLVTYRYPMGLLNSTKNKVYSSEGGEIFR